MGQIGLDGQALALHSFATDGFLYRTGNSTFTAATSGSVNAPIMLAAAAPAASTSPGTRGQIAFAVGAGATYMYACTATGTATENRWGRITLTTF